MNDARQRFAGKVVVVTGSSSGIGAATAGAFAAEGARVALTAPQSELPALQGLTARMSSEGYRCACFAVDITRQEQVVVMVEQVLELWGRIDLLINNAGVGYHGPFDEMPLDDFEKVMQINLLGAVRCLYAVLPGMIRQGTGQVVNIASAHSRRAHPRYAAYSASKYALRGLSDTLRMELAPLGIGVLTYCPPYTESRFFDNVLHSVGTIKPQRAGMSPEVVAKGIVEATWRRKREVIVSLREKTLDWGNRCVPTLIDLLISRRYQAKLEKQT